jgi:tetratricopeptide (TPR) repeat protein
MRTRTIALVLAAFAIVFVALELNAYTRKSATWDEPMHLTSGYAALTARDHRIDPSHPPLVRMWAALPLLFTDRPALDTSAIDRTPPATWVQQAYAFAHRFLYVDHDADRLLYRARFMIVLLGVLLGVLLFCWVYEWLGVAPAAIALVLFVLEPNIAAHAALVTTDLGVTCFMFGAVYFLWRCARRVTPFNVAGVALCTALALTTKFSAVVLLPILGGLLALAVWRGAITLRAAGTVTAACVAAAALAVWTAYGLRYAPSGSPGWEFRFGESVLSSSVLSSLRLLPNAFTHGFVYSQTSVGQIPAFLAGEYSTDGWWYYFPYAMAIKTPLALLALTAGGLIAVWRTRATPASPLSPPLTRAFVLLPIAVWLGVAMASGINIGVRHILPVYPFVLLLASAAVAALLARGRSGRAWAAAAVAVLALEFSSVYPHNLTFFNLLVGGPDGGFRYLTDSNIGWGQNLKPLKAWMDRQGVDHINLAYFGQADPDYYMIDATWLPGAPQFAIERVGRPRLPGYVAISSTVLSGVYLAPAWRLFYRPFLDLEPQAVIGHSIRVYWVDRWPDATGRYTDLREVDAHRVLADVLLFGQQWPTRALEHYREYLRFRPDESEAMVNAAFALYATNEPDEAMLMLRRAVGADPANGRAHLALGRGLVAGRDIATAIPHAERAVALLPGEPAATDLLGRLRAMEGRFAEATTLFHRTLELDPANAAVRELLAQIPAGAGRR